MNKGSSDAAGMMEGPSPVFGGATVTFKMAFIQAGHSNAAADSDLNVWM